MYSLREALSSHWDRAGARRSPRSPPHVLPSLDLPSGDLDGAGRRQADRRSEEQENHQQQRAGHHRRPVQDGNRSGSSGKCCDGAVKSRRGTGEAHEASSFRRRPPKSQRTWVAAIISSAVCGRLPRLKRHRSSRASRTNCPNVCGYPQDELPSFAGALHERRCTDRSDRRQAAISRCS